MVDHAEDPLAGVLDRLEDAQLVRRLAEPELTYSFKHALTQETTYNSILGKRRRVIHRAVAEAYEHLYPDRLDEHAALLAEHYGVAGDDAKTLEYAIRAGDSAARVYANAEALAHYNRAMKLADRGVVLRGEGDRKPLVTDLYLRRGRVLELSDRYPDALSSYEELEARGRTQGNAAMELVALMARALVYCIGNREQNVALGRDLSDRAVRLARDLGDRAAEARALWIWMLARIFGGEQLTQAAHYGEESLAIARELNLREQMAFTLNDLAKLYGVLGESARGEAAGAEAAQLWRSLGNLPMLAENLAGFGFLYFALGRYDKALAAYEESLHIYESIGDGLGQVTSQMVSGLIQFDRGHPGKAIENLWAVIRLGEQTGHGGEVWVRLQLGWLYANLGATRQGFDMIDEAYVRIEGQRPTWGRAVRGMLARIRLLDGDVEGAAATLGDHYRGFQAYGLLFLDGPVHVALAHAELAAATGEYSRSATVIEELLDALETLELRVYMPDALYAKAYVQLMAGETEDARTILNEARTQVEAMGSRSRLWRILALLAEVQDRRGRRGEARKLRAEAREHVEYIAGQIDAPDLRMLFVNLPSVRALLDEAAR